MTRWNCTGWAVLWLMVAVSSIGPTGARAGAAKADAPAGEEAQAHYDKVVDAYLHNRWDELAEAMKIPRKTLSQLSREQGKDIAYVRKAATECRPAWWKQSKTGRKFRFRPSIFGRSFAATFSPKEKPGFTMQTVSGRMVLTFSWKIDDLDSLAPPNDKSMAGHGTKQGDMAEVNLWMNLANAALIASFPMRTLKAIYDDDTSKQRFGRYQMFQAQLASVYHGSPRSRHAAMVMHFSAFMAKYSKGRGAGTRRAIGSMFIAHLLAEPKKWPSIHLPESLGDDEPEAALGEFCIRQIDRRWTLAEDRQLREAALALYKANSRTALKTDKVLLPNKLVSMLDPDKDEKPKAARNAWVAKMFEKATKQQ